MSRVAVFIDAAYLERVIAADLGGIRVDHQWMIQQMLGKDNQLVQAFYYDCLPYLSKNPSPSDYQHHERKAAFFRHLEHAGFEVRVGRLVYRGLDRDERPIYLQKRVDTSMAIDLIKSCYLYGSEIQDIYLVGGDDDHVPAILDCVKSGQNVTLWHGSNNSTVGFSEDLLNTCNNHRYVTDLFQL